MAIPTPRTWAAGETVTAAMLNTNVRDAVLWLLAGKPHFHGYQTASQSLTDVTPAAITMAGELVDTISGHSTSVNTSRYTPNVAGKYFCLGQVSFNANATGQRTAEFRKNGVAITGSGYGGYAGFGGSFAANAALAIATMVCNGSTDYIELWGNQNSGGTLGTDNISSQSMMIITWICS